jgi:hypothetical protein
VPIAKTQKGPKMSGLSELRFRVMAQLEAHLRQVYQETASLASEAVSAIRTVVHNKGADCENAKRPEDVRLERMLFESCSASLWCSFDVWISSIPRHGSAWGPSSPSVSRNSIIGQW